MDTLTSKAFPEFSLDDFKSSCLNSDKPEPVKKTSEVLLPSSTSMPSMAATKTAPETKYEKATKFYSMNNLSLSPIPTKMSFRLCFMNIQEPNINATVINSSNYTISECQFRFIQTTGTENHATNDDEWKSIR